MALILLSSLALCAGAEGINLDVDIQSSTDKITVTVDNSEDTNTILAAEKPTLTVNCEFPSAYVIHNQQLVTSTLDTAAKTIQFQVAAGGTYEILSGIAPATYTVTFNANGHGTAPQALSVLSGNKITRPADPTETGFAFGGWYKEAACTNAWSFDTDTVTENTTLYAKWTEAFHTVTFHANGHGTAPDAQRIREGDKVTKPTDLTAQGFMFRGWYTDEACSDDKKWDFNNDTVTGPTDLYAKWIPAFTVTFHANGHGRAPAVQTVASGSKAIKPTDPTATGYTFGGWYTDEECKEENKWNFDTRLTASVDLYAKWTVNTYTVTFDSNGHGVDPEEQSVNHGGKALEPTAPEAAGFTFGGWYMDPICNESDKWNFDTAITADRTLYAKWTYIPAGSTSTGNWTWDVDDDNAGTLNPEAAGLSGIAVSATASDDVEITLIVTSLSESEVSNTEKNAIKAAANGRNLSYLDLTLTKRINGGAATDIGATNAGLLQITLDFPTENRDYFRVYRYHNDSVDTLTETKNNLDERIAVSDGQITIYARRFSTYAIGYCTGNNKPDSTITEVKVTPDSVSMRKGTSKTFTATVTGTESFDETVTWTVSGNKSSSTKIDKDGKLTIASGETARTLTVKATSNQDKNKSDTATVTVTKDTSSANTGDQFNPILWISLMVLCVVGVVVLILLKKRK